MTRARARTCSVAAHARRLPARRSRLDTPKSRALEACVEQNKRALAEMEAEIEAALSDPVFLTTGGIAIVEVG